MKEIGVSAFQGCSNLSFVVLSNSEILIRSNAFENTAWYENQPEGLVYAGSSAYKYKGTMPDNTEIILKNGTKSISDRAFANCKGLTSVVIPDGVKSIGWTAFSGCTNLSSITIPESVSYVDYYAFEGTEWYANQPEGVVYVGNVAYAYKGLGSNAEVVLREGTTRITTNCFLAKSIKSIVIPEGVTCMDNQVFMHCTTLESVYLPSSLEQIGAYAFELCKALKDVYCEAVTPPSLGRLPFVDSNYTNATLHVPYGCKAAYEAAYYWEQFKEIVEMDTNISKLDNAIYVEATDGLIGNTVKLNVKMKNVVTPVGCSFTLKLPEGMTLAKDADGDIISELENRARMMSVTMKDWNDGSYDFALLPSSETATISGNDGTIISFRVCIPDDAVAGNYKLLLTKDLIQTKGDGMTQDNATLDVITTISVYDYPLGDVSGDGKVTPSDAIMILYHYFGVEQSGFKAVAADMTGDGNITPADAIEALYKYFDANHNKAPQKPQPTLEPQ